MRNRRRERLLSLLLAAGVVAGCPSRFDPRAEPITARSPDPAAARAYDDAKARLDAGDLPAAAAGFADFEQRYAGDPLAPAAALWQARAELGLGREGTARAVALTEPLATRAAGDPVGDRARFLLGLALARGDDPASARRARDLLAPFVPVIAEGDDAVELHAALAEAAARAGDPGLALVELERFHDGARPVERAYVRERGRDLVDRLDAAQLSPLYRSARAGGLGAALLGRRLGELARAAGDGATAARLEADTAAGRARFGLDEGSAAGNGGAGAAGGGGGGGGAVGLVVPLSGRFRLVGERALRGALLGAEALPAGASTVRLEVRDDQSSPEVAARAVDELAALGVAAVVVSPERAEAAAAATRAEALGVPVLELAPDEQAAGAARFKVVPRNAARAEALAERAVAGGAQRLVVLYPDSPYGNRMAEAFAATATARGAKVLDRLRFDERATTFIAPAKRIAALHPDAVFVPATATQLELVAAQLYATGVTRVASARGSKGGAAQGVLLLATADGLSAKLLESAGRYLQGALLAPVFFADGADPRIGPFVERYREQYTDDPGAADALAFDAVRAVRAAVEGSPPGEERRAARERLRGGAGEGLTGPLGFADGGVRAGTPTLYAVDGDAIRALRR